MSLLLRVMRIMTQVNAGATLAAPLHLARYVPPTTMPAPRQLVARVGRMTKLRSHRSEGLLTPVLLALGLCPALAHAAERTPDAVADAAVTTADAQAQDKGTEVQRVDVVGQTDRPTPKVVSSTATRTDTPTMETPMSVQVVPQYLLQEQRLHSISDVVRNVSGITRGASYGVGDTYSIRGFQHGDATYEDGAKMSNGAAVALPRGLANIEQVEVIKGPASILYGQGEPGGLVNNVTKKPLDYDHLSLEQEIASFGRYSTHADLSGPLDDDATLLYRLNLSYETEASYRDFVSTQRLDAYPTLQWKISPQTQISTQWHVGHGYGYVGDAGIPLVNGQRAAVPLSRNVGEPDLNRNHVDEYSVKVAWSHDFNDHWTLRNYVKFEDIQSCKGGLYQTYGLSEPDAAGDIPRALSWLYYNGTKTINASMDLTGKFDNFGIQHTVLTGVDHYRLNEYYAGGSSLEFDSTTGDLLSTHFPSINLYNPIYRQPRDPLYRGNDFMVDHTAQAYGVFVQDQIELPFQWFLLLGLRHDGAVDRSNLDPNGNNAYPAYDSPTFKDKPPLSHRYGVLWRPLPELSLYTSYTENFGASSYGQIQFDGGRTPGETAQQYEVGAKTELFNKRLTGSMSLYQLTKQNVLTTDPVHGQPYVIPLGEVRSRGVEMDISGEIYPRWNVTASYAYIDSLTTKAYPVELLGPTAGVPHHSANLWATYAFEGRWRGLKLGGGITAASDQLDYFKNTIPGYATVDLYASYGWRVHGTKVSTQLNVTNALGKVYYPATDNIPGKPRSVLATVRIEH